MCNMDLEKCSFAIQIIWLFVDSYVILKLYSWLECSNLTFLSRFRVQQITGVTNNMQRRCGIVLPPPADDYCNNSSAIIGKPTVNTYSNVRLFGYVALFSHSFLID